MLFLFIVLVRIYHLIELVFLKIILDDSGRWPSKGVFAAISQRSKEPEKQYEFLKFYNISFNFV